MKITTDFPGGNIEIVGINENTVKVKPDFRDTAGDWFYWAFRVSGASGKTITFDFSPYGYIGYHGPAVSSDLKEWRWVGGNGNPYSFTYAFEENENDIYFAHDMLYGTERFYSFTKRTGLKADRLCVSEKGRDVPTVRFGSGANMILFTARHHCCESTGSYVLEGVLEELYKNPIPNCRVTAVPFVDFDGVTDGDQGKNRIPHDHNRDYNDNPVYASVKAIKNIAAAERIRYAFDFHSPWHTGGRNDKLFFVRGNDRDAPKYAGLGKILERETGRDSIKYNPADDIEPGEEWNKPEKGLVSFGRFFSDCQEAALAMTVETPYFALGDNIVSQKKLICTGKAFARAFREYDKNANNYY